MTGTFDDWAKSVKLDKTEGSLFQKSVDLPVATEKIYYKVCEELLRDHQINRKAETAMILICPSFNNQLT